MGSYLSAASALGLQFKLVPHDQHEALDLYERNWRHIDPRSLSLEELILIRSIFAIAGREVHFV